ncbi:MAG: N-acetylneuraminate synthase family protein [Cyanobacteriota bacterium]|nr:N-acetylneuraminate synthase family protein [Cyanobacteriota bacterium]
MDRDNWSGSFHIGERTYGGRYPSYIIAEIGSNHGGSLERSKEFASACAEAGANAVKFQSWSARKLQNIKDLTSEGQLHESKVIPILEKYEVPESWHSELAAYCRSLGVDFLSTPFDIDRARWLQAVKVPAIKISSGDLTYCQLLEEVGQYNVPILLSTGMASLGDIEAALERLRADRHSSPPHIVLLHCVAAYPPQLEDANLLAIRTLREAFNLPVGISDHFSGYDTVLAAVALGAGAIEKHVTFSRTDGHPDSFFALEIDEFRAMVAAVRNLESALGDGRKQCRPSEADGRVGGRRCLFAARDLEAGRTIAREDISVVRPNIGPLKPQDLDRVLGRQVRKAIPAGMPLSWDDVESP